GGGGGAAQCGKIGGELEFGWQLLPDRYDYRQFQGASLAVRLDQKLIIAGSGARRRLQAQLQLLFAIGRDKRRLDRLTAAEDRRFPSVRRLRYRKRQLARRQIEVAQREIDCRGLARAYRQSRISGRQVEARDAGRLVRRISSNRRHNNK